MKTYTYEEALEASTEYFGNDLSARAFVDKYALRNKNNELLESTPTEMHKRLAKEFARIEKNKFQKPLSEQEIFEYLDHFKSIIPQGSPMYGIGNKYQYVSTSNCFVVDNPYDSYGGICYSDQQLVQISKRRGGVGIDLSTLRPVGSRTQNSSRSSTGIPAWMERYSNTIREVGQSGRRGALMETISVHHPDILKFATIKNDDKSVTGANISVRLSDEFLKALRKNEDYELRWPIDAEVPEYTETISAKKVWNTIINSAWFRAEPGLLFWDTILKFSPADCYDDFATISTNPCGEIPLCAYDSCRLLAINLFHAVENPYTDKAKFNFDTLAKTVQISQRLMDDMIDLEIEAIDRILSKLKKDPEPEHIKQCELELWWNIKNKAVRGRRTGLGITALGDVLAALGIKYGSNKSVKMTGKIYKTLKLNAYRSSVDMAKELGAFPEWKKSKEIDHPFLDRIGDEDPKLFSEMEKYGRRNIALLTTAPTGTVSMMAQLEDGKHGTTSGIEPMYQGHFVRRKKGNPGDEDFRSDFVDDMGDHWMEFDVYHPGIVMWMEANDKTVMRGNPYVAADSINWANRIKLQAAAQRHVDHSISSTINLPNNISERQVAKIYLDAWENNLKGVTVYRDGCRTGVLIQKEPDKINKNNAPKRPDTLPCDVHHFVTKGVAYAVVVGLFEHDPYEAFIIRNIDNDGEYLIPKEVKAGKTTKIGRSNYKLYYNGSEFSISKNADEYEEMISRLVSTTLRHGVDVEYVLHQLEKSKKDLFSLGQSMVKCLKKYVQDGTEIKGEECPQCSDKLIRGEGCRKCISCGWSQC